MLQDMDNVEARFIFHVEVGTFIHSEQSKNALVTVNDKAIVWLTVHHDLIASFIFKHYPGHSVRHAATDLHSLVQ
jgi:hypothetical protein